MKIAQRLQRWRTRGMPPQRDKPCLGHWHEHMHDLKCLDCLDYWECLKQSVAHRKQLMREGKLIVEVTKEGEEI